MVPRQKCEDGNVGAVEVALKTHVYLGETSWSYVATVMKILERLRRGFTEGERENWKRRRRRRRRSRLDSGCAKDGNLHTH